MKIYEKNSISLVPGPTFISSNVLEAFSQNYCSADLEDEFFQLYESVQLQLKELFKTEKHDVVIQSGEAMVALWGALKSILSPGDKVLAIGTGIYGFGIGEMAKQIGASVEFISYEYDEICRDFEKIRKQVLEFQPKVITAVHCETPSGTLNPLKEIGEISAEVNAIFYVDMVSSGGAVDISLSDWKIDVGLLGTQKALSCPPDLGIVFISQKTWNVISNVGYVGYDALAPWKNSLAMKYFPYTHNWHALEALSCALHNIKNEGFEKVFQRHTEVASYCRKRCKGMGLTLFPKEEQANSPTVTACYVPQGWTWKELDASLRKRGVFLGGNYDPLVGKVFRIGHMGTQANMDLVEKGMNILEEVLKTKNSSV